MPKEILLLNDSFPPAIDGVANAVTNYAKYLQNTRFSPCVVTPRYPGADDSGYDYPVIRYPSIDLRKSIGYTAGIPFVPKTVCALSRHDTALMHSHCPMASNYLARTLRRQFDAPMILTYHTKFDVDIANTFRSQTLRRGAMRALLDNVRAADELWVVSKGAGESLRRLGYTGGYVVMHNGVDLPRGRAKSGAIAAETGGYDLPAGVPVFLFAGRMMWYKGLKIIVDALAILLSRGKRFRMVFVGGGQDEKEVRAYAEKQGIGGVCIFTGIIRERERLQAWYSRADLFLFPSDFDTSGLVVKEAAACLLGSVLLRGSCAAEGVVDGKNGFLTDGDPASLAARLADVMDKKHILQKIGANASRDLYISWETAVREAAGRYEDVIENYKAGKYGKKRRLTDKALAAGGVFLDKLGALERQMPERQRKNSARDRK